MTSLSDLRLTLALRLGEPRANQLLDTLAALAKNDARVSELRQAVRDELAKSPTVGDATSVGETAAGTGAGTAIGSAIA